MDEVPREDGPIYVQEVRDLPRQEKPLVQRSERVCVATGTGITNGCERGTSRTPRFGARINANRRPAGAHPPPSRPRHLPPKAGTYSVPGRPRIVGRRQQIYRCVHLYIGVPPRSVEGLGPIALIVQVYIYIYTLAHTYLHPYLSPAHSSPPHHASDPSLAVSLGGAITLIAPAHWPPQSRCLGPRSRP